MKKSKETSRVKNISNKVPNRICDTSSLIEDFDQDGSVCQGMKMDKIVEKDDGREVINLSVKLPKKSKLIRTVLTSVVVLIVTSVLLSCSVLAYSLKLKNDGDKNYKQQNYSEALEKYQKAKPFWFLERVNYFLRDRDLEAKTKKAEVMIKSNQNYLDGIREYEQGNYDQASYYFQRVVENDSSYGDATDKINAIIEKKNEDIKNKNKPTAKIPGSPTSVSNTPKIDCVGVDGKHFLTTQDECTKFNNAWSSPIPTTTTNQGSIAFTPSTPITFIAPTPTPAPTYEDLHCPTIIGVKDSLGNTSKSGNWTFKKGEVSTITLTVEASDPQNLPLYYRYQLLYSGTLMYNSDGQAVSSLNDVNYNSIVIKNVENTPAGVFTMAVYGINNKDNFLCPIESNLAGSFRYTILP